MSVNGESRNRSDETCGSCCAVLPSTPFVPQGRATQLLQRDGASEPDTATVDQMTQQLASMTAVDEQGRPQITISLPDEQSLRSIAATLARLLQ